MDGRVRIDSRTFIRPPFTECPKCHAQELGVLMVCEQHYVRRCRSCLTPVSIPLPTLRKRIVYLDQFAISNMMKRLNPATAAHRAGRVPECGFR